MKKFLTVIATVSLSLFIISLSVNIALNFKGIYYAFADKIDAHMTKDEIKENYNAVTDYLSGKENKLSLPSSISKSGEIHFEEVKNIFMFFKYTLYISFFISILCVGYLIKNKSTVFLKLTALITSALPVLSGIVTSIFPDEVFILFHKICFRNDFWIFDERTDPIITILPQEFFIAEAILIFAFIFICACLSYLVKISIDKKRIL